MSTAVSSVRSLAHLEPPSDGPHPDWLAPVRREALEWVAQHGFPAAKDEDWRYTPLRVLLEAPLEAARPDTSGGSVLAPLARVADLGGAQLVFVNGFYAPFLSRPGRRSEGIAVTNMAAALAAGDGRLRAALERPLPAYRHAFHALNTALATDGAFIHLAPGAVLDEPVHLVFISESGDAPVLVSPRSIVIGEAGSQVTVVETYLGTPGSTGCTNARTDVELQVGARVEHYKVQDEPVSVTHLASLGVRQGADSSFRSHSVTLGAGLARDEVSVRLEAERAQVDLGGLYLPGDGQCHDNPVLIEHVAPGGTSRQLFKGVVDGDGHGIFNGHIIVGSGAFRTDARQTNRNLLLSDRAEVDTRPRLEIFADDVQCAHGATVGQLDEDALFYLRSRGIPRPVARALLIEAFAGEIVSRIVPAQLAALVQRLVADRLCAGVPERSRERTP